MRKDVRTGAAIGGILIAVIVVYAIVVSKNHTNNKKDQVAVDPGKTSPAGDPAGGADAVTGAHDEHADPSATLSHDVLTFSGTPAATPSHVDDSAGSTPPPTPDLDATSNDHGKKWTALIDGSQTLTRASDRDHMITADPVPTGDNTTRGGVITAVDHTQSDSPARDSDPIPAGAAIPASDTHDRTAPPATPATAQTHRVASGETFSSIARAVYGDAKYFKEIIKANPKVDPTRLKPGMVIVLPEKHDAAPATPPAAPTAPAEIRHRTTTAAVPVAAINPKTEYRVKANDNLYKISMKLYDSPNKVDAIYQLNKEQIGADPAKLKLNMVLKLPEAPNTTSSH